MALPERQAGKWYNARVSTKGITVTQAKEKKPSFISQINQEILKPFARKYIWWQTPEESVAYPLRVIAQVMNIGTFSHMQALALQVGDDVLKEALFYAEAGWFNERSWFYWHYRLELSEIGRVPPLPVRRFA